MDLENMKQALIASAVRVVARDGLENTTTKSIAQEAKRNEAYIYKCFASKEELLAAALYQEDLNFSDFLLETLPVMNMMQLTWKERAYILWKRSWEFILEDPDDCIFYIRYYYSASCHAYEHHMKCYQPVFDRVRPAFKNGENMNLVIHQVFCTMLFYASCVVNGTLENSESTTTWVFEQIYSFIVPNICPERLECGGIVGSSETAHAPAAAPARDVPRSVSKRKQS